MSRLNIRCQVDLPVVVSAEANGERKSWEKTSFSNLSLGGGLIHSRTPYPKKKMLNLRYHLPKHGDMEVKGEVVRHDGENVATMFHDVGKDAKLKLWEYLREHVAEISFCPYCRNENISNSTQCDKCGLTLKFDSPDYILAHERWLFLKKLSMKSEFFSLEDISRILNFVDVNILGISTPSADYDSKTLYDGLSRSTSLKEAKKLIEKQKLIETLKNYNHNISKVAKALEVSRPSVYSMMKKYGIQH